MRKYYSDETKNQTVQQFINGKSVSEIHKQTGISRSTLYSWIDTKSEEKTFTNSEKIKLRDYHDLVAKCERQEKIIQILKDSPCTVTSPLRERYAVIKNFRSKYSETLLCDALNVSKGSYFNHIFRNKNDTTQYALKAEEMTPIIEQIYHESNQIYGPGKIHAILKDRGYTISNNVVARIMHQNGLFAIRTSSKTLYEQEQKRKENILKQNFTVNRPNEVWVSDVTYFKFNDTTYYICVIIDLYARKVIAYNISTSNNTRLTKRTLKDAFESRKPNLKLIFHSDNGSNYTSKSFMKYVKELNITQSFSRPHIPYDNSVMESFFKTLKTEELYRARYRSERDFKESVSKYITFYNSQRPHSIIKYWTPNKWEAKYWDKNNRTQSNKNIYKS